MHERTLLGVTNEEGFPLCRGMPTGLVGSYLDGVCRSLRRDKGRYGFLVVTGAMSSSGKCTRSHETSQRDSLLHVRYINCN